MFCFILDIPPIVVPCYHLGMDDLLPNKTPQTFKPRMFKKVSIYVGNPISFEDLLKRLKEEQKSAVSLFITSLVLNYFDWFKGGNKKNHNS